MLLDSRDMAILSVLSTEGRISKAALAARVNLSPTPVWERLRRLEAAGLIRGYRAQIDLARLGPHVTVFVMVELDSHRAESFQAFERNVALRPEVVGCWAIGGGFDYLMQVIAADIPAFQALMDGLLESRAGLRRYFSHIVTKPILDRPPLTALLDGAS